MTNLIDALHIPDTQAEHDERELAIQRVGIRGVRYPLQLAIEGTVLPTVAEWALDVALPAEQKGTHMSRFVAWLDALGDPVDAAMLERETARMLSLLNADAGRVEAAFPFFLRKRAPVSGVESLLEYQGRLICEMRGPAPPSVAAPRGHEGDLGGPRGAAGAGAAPRPAGATSWAEVVVPVKSLCPCSKEISDYGAHNQRSNVTIRVELLGAISWRELVRFAEDQASSEIWSSLKRADEKWITERAYENPKFVEDMVRDVALALNADARVGRYTVDVENFESIHAHSAVAQITRA